MGRILFSYVLPAVAPTAIYLAWLQWARWRARRRGLESLPELRSGPWMWLVLAGAVLAVFGLLLTMTLDRNAPGGVYEAPHVVDGKIVPGRVVPKVP